MSQAQKIVITPSTQRVLRHLITEQEVLCFGFETPSSGGHKMLLKKFKRYLLHSVINSGCILLILKTQILINTAK
jgi:hypothetical protein